MERSEWTADFDNDSVVVFHHKDGGFTAYGLSVPDAQAILRALNSRNAEPCKQLYIAIQDLQTELHEMKAEQDHKARYDRYVCAVASGHVFESSEGIAERALSLMLAADKRWEEYTKGGQSE
jgi:hypothetical protein